MDVEARLESLERQNRMMKRAVIALGMVVLAVVAVGAVTPGEVKELIEASEFRVIGENGRPRVVLSGSGYFPVLLLDENGRVRARLGDSGIGFQDESTLRASLAVDGIAFKNETGQPLAWMGVLGIAYSDQNGNVRVALSEDGLSYLDETGQTRAELGVLRQVGQPAGAESRTQASVALYDADGLVIWQAPRPAKSK